jgi:hypothetical protein
MPSQWQAICKDCGQSFTYSDFVHRSRVARGLSAPERCNDHRAQHARETNAMASSHFTLQPVERPDILGVRFLGAFDRSDRGAPDLREIPADPAGVDLGLKDEHMLEIYEALGENKVLVIVAPTGAGKSTMIPYRLLSPVPESGLREDHFTQHGRKIIVTQPRRDATSDIPAMIAGKLHGSTLGPGSEIGYRHSDARDQTDAWNRMIFLTDGTLANWLVDQRASEFSIIIVDEAHERSTTIDFILGLVRSELLKHPHLRLIILSATIHADSFVQFFEQVLPGRVWFKDFDECEKSYGYEVRWPKDDRERAPGEMVDAVANKVLDLLRSTEDGGILAFLPGEADILAAVESVKRRLAGQLRDRTLVLPLYGVLPRKERAKATGPVKAPKGHKGPLPRRVVIASNLVETSQTIPDVAHVIDSGLIKESAWDPVTRTESLPRQWHSQAGCRQRWGRAGRNRPGIVYPLYSKTQFESFEPYTKPAVARECLDEVVIRAKRAGVSELEGFAWLDAPPEDEIRRVEGLVADRNYVDADGDLTERGSEVFDLYQRVGRFIGEGAGAAARGLDMAALLILADRYGCLVEAATFLAIQRRIGEGLYRREGLLHFDREWPRETADLVGRLHSSLRAGCQDDLDFGLKLIALCEFVDLGGKKFGGRHWAQAHSLNCDSIEEVLAERDQILSAFNQDTRDRPMRSLSLGHFDRLRLLIGAAWPDRTVELIKGGRWQSLTTEDSGPISIHSQSRYDTGEAAVAEYGRRNRDEEGVYSKEPIASVIVLSDRAHAKLDDVALAAQVRALRVAADDARSRMTWDIVRPVDSPAGESAPGKVIVRWTTGEDSGPSADLADKLPPRLSNEEVAGRNELMVTLERSISYPPAGRIVGFVGRVLDRTVFVGAGDLSLTGTLPMETDTGSEPLQLVVVNRRGAYPRLSLLPRIEEMWESLLRQDEVAGRFEGFHQSAAGDVFLEMLTEIPGALGGVHAVGSIMPYRADHLRELQPGDEVFFKVEKLKDRQWSWELRDDDVEDEPTERATPEERRRLGVFGIELAGRTLRTATRLSVDQFYVAIGSIPKYEAAIRGLFHYMHDLRALPDSIETAASRARARQLRGSFKALWDRAWSEDTRSVAESARMARRGLASEHLSKESLDLLHSVLNDIFEICDLRSAAERAASKRAFVQRSRDYHTKQFAYHSRNLEDLRTKIRDSVSPQWRLKASGWIPEKEAAIVACLRDRSLDEPKWTQALAEAEALEQKARLGSTRLAELKRRRWD